MKLEKCCYCGKKGVYVVKNAPYDPDAIGKKRCRYCQRFIDGMKMSFEEKVKAKRIKDFMKIVKKVKLLEGEQLEEIVRIAKKVREKYPDREWERHDVGLCCRVLCKPTWRSFNILDEPEELKKPTIFRASGPISTRPLNLGIKGEIEPPWLEVLLEPRGTSNFALSEDVLWIPTPIQFMQLDEWPKYDDDAKIKREWLIGPDGCVWERIEKGNDVTISNVYASEDNEPIEISVARAWESLL